MKVLPIGTQTFEKLRNDNAIYVDKTEHIYNLIKSGNVYFLSRPRRFGKSLLISTFKELFKGSKKLFEWLYIYDKWDWSKKYTVIHLDFAEIAYKTNEELERSLNMFLESIVESQSLGVEKSAPIQVKFVQIIEKLHEKAGERVVILVDEYDKPLIDNLSNKEVYPEVKRTLHDFYQVIKASDEHLRFVFLTGVSRFSGLSIFSGLNNLNDITMDNRYGAICGYTQEELENNFKGYIENVSQAMEMREYEVLSEIKRWYNGYSWDGKTFVYNPLSTLMFFDKKEFKGYWFATGTPTFLVGEIERMDNLYIEPKVVGDEVLIGSGNEKQELTSLLFQTGYLTVKRKERGEDNTPEYELDFPNMEVRKAFIGNMIEEYTKKERSEVASINKRVGKALKERDEEGLKKNLVELFANIPYDILKSREAYYHALFLMIARMSEYMVEGEVHTDKGRIDAVLKKGNDVIVVEIKYDKDKPINQQLKEGMGQIKEKRYYEKYASNEVSLLAVAFGNEKEIGCQFQKRNDK